MGECDRIMLIMLMYKKKKMTLDRMRIITNLHVYLMYIFL